jgi:hypothetical protein
MKTSELTDAALDWAVCEATGLLKDYPRFQSGKGFLEVYGVARNKHSYTPSTDWAQGGPIIEREGIAICPFIDHKGRIESWQAGAFEDAVFGTTPLIAAMRWYVASILGDEVDVPTELTQGETQ